MVVPSDAIRADCEARRPAGVPALIAEGLVVSLATVRARIWAILTRLDVTPRLEGTALLHNTHRAGTGRGRRHAEAARAAGDGRGIDPEHTTPRFRAFYCRTVTETARDSLASVATCYLTDRHEPPRSHDAEDHT